MEDGVLEDLDVIADPYGAMGVADDLDPGADDRPFADNDVAGDLGAGEQHRGGGDAGENAPVVVELAHGAGLRSGFDQVRAEGLGSVRSPLRNPRSRSRSF